MHVCTMIILISVPNSTWCQKVVLLACSSQRHGYISSIATRSIWPDSWPKWIRRFERFCQAPGLQGKAEESQVNTLIYTMDDKADDLLSSFGLSDEDQKKYSTVKEKFNGYFVKRRNVMFERARFNSRKQLKEESVDNFVTDLFSLVEHCGYGPLRDEMVRDRLVVGLLDASLSEKMQLDPELTLDKVLSMAWHSEAVRKQQPVVRGTAQHNGLSEETVDTLTTRNANPPKPPPKYHIRGEQQQSAKCSGVVKVPGMVNNSALLEQAYAKNPTRLATTLHVALPEVFLG